MDANTLFTCPCCGFKSLKNPPGSYDICKFCNWEDDLYQMLEPQTTGGANDVCLIEAQHNFAQYGAYTKQSVQYVTSPDEPAIRDTTWRPVLQTDFDYSKRPPSYSVLRKLPYKEWYYWSRTKHIS